MCRVQILFDHSSDLYGENSVSGLFNSTVVSLPTATVTCCNPSYAATISNNQCIKVYRNIIELNFCFAFIDYLGLSFYFMPKNRKHLKKIVNINVEST